MLLVAPPRPAAALFRPRSGRSSPSTAWRGPRSPPAWRPCWATAATPTASSRSWSCWRCGALRGRGAGGSAARGGLGGTHGPALPQAKEEEDVLCAARTCRRLFAALLRRGELFAGSLPAEEDALRGERGRPGRGRAGNGAGNGRAAVGWERQRRAFTSQGTTALRRNTRYG